MAITQAQEARALSTEERELVEQSHHPVLQKLPDTDLQRLVRLVRERRDRATTRAAQQRRERRGKAAAKGAAPAARDEGSHLKAAVLSAAMRRLNSEAARRQKMAAKATLRASATRALELKRSADTQDPAFNSRSAHYGMREIASERRENLIRPMELGRQRQAAKVAQAKKDSR